MIYSKKKTQTKTAKQKSKGEEQQKKLTAKKRIGLIKIKDSTGNIHTLPEGS